MPREKWKISMSLGKNQLILTRNRNCNWSSRSHAEESKNSQQHLLKKRKDASADLKSEHAKKEQ